VSTDRPVQASTPATEAGAEEAAPRRLRSLKLAAAVTGGVAVALTLVGFGLLRSSGSSPSGGASLGMALVKPGKPLRLAGKDPVSGRHVSLDAYRGQPVLLNVWASWCPPCNKEAPRLTRFMRTHPQARVVGLDYADTVGGARAYYRRWGWKQPSIADSGAMFLRLGYSGLPVTLFLDASHRVVARILGPGTLAEFERGYRLARARRRLDAQAAAISSAGSAAFVSCRSSASVSASTTSS
jgi:thiol-disulfide isomerase/thioredoxin